MSDNVSAKDLSDAFKYLLSYQLDSIAVDGVMPSAHGALHKLLCSCYSKDTEVVDIYDVPRDAQEDHYTKTPVIDKNKHELPSPPPPERKRLEEKKSPIIVEVYDDTPDSKMMLSTVKNPYGGGGGSNNNNSNHRMVIEDVTDDPEYSSYGNENEKPENEEEGAFIEYEKLDKTEDPAAYKVCHSTRAINRTYNNIRPSFRMPIEGSGGSVARGMRIEPIDLSDVEDGARCRDKECRLGWKQHAWRYVY